MLRIRRLKKEIVVSFREKEKWISRPFRNGLLLAFGFHLLLFSLFRVQSRPWPQHRHTLHPATVEVVMQSVSPTVEVEQLFFVHQESPHLPSPILNLPLHSGFPELAPPTPPPLTESAETIEYEALDIDFNDDRD